MISLINSTVEQSWPFLIFILIIYFIFRFFYVTSSRRKINLLHEIYYILFVVYIFLLSSIVSYGELNVASGINLVPFKEIFRYTLFSNLFFTNIIGNILLFAPLGYFFGYFLKTKKTSLVIFLSTIISLTGELLQRYIGRIFDIDDIILNVVGATIGFLIYKFLYKIYRKLPNALQKDGLYNTLCIIIIIAIIFYLLEVIGVINFI